MLSVIIPSRVDQYLQRTIDDLLIKAEGEIEIIVVLDGYWPNPMLKNDPRVKVLHQGLLHDNFGMRASINAGISIACGDYILKADEHTMWDQGYDVKLKTDMRDDWLVIPRRKRLDAEKWENINDGRRDIDYMYVEYPYVKPLDKTQGLHGAEWRRPERDDIMLDSTPTMQGSAWFIKRDYFNRLFPSGMDDEKYGFFTQEAQELSNTVWLSGGQVMVNKKTWYSHLHKGKGGKSYGFTREQYKRHSEMNERGRLYCINYWLNTVDYLHDWNWFVTKLFKDMPGWSADWRERVERDRLKDYSTLGYKDDFWLSNLREPDAR